MAFDRGEQHYRIKAGPSTRRLIDLSDPNASLGINPLGQAGNPLDDHAQDQAEMFNEGRYRTQLFDWLSIQALPDRLLLQPASRQR
jgi:penicillin amidase